MSPGKKTCHEIVKILVGFHPLQNINNTGFVHCSCDVFGKVWKLTFSDDESVSWSMVKSAGLAGVSSGMGLDDGLLVCTLLLLI